MRGVRWLAAALLAVTACTSGGTPTAADRLLVLGDDGNVVTFRPDGTDEVALTTDAGDEVVYAQPTWSPTAEQVAFARIHRAGGAEAALVTVAADGSDRPEDGAGGPAGSETPTPAPPFFIHWSPDGARLVFLADGTDGLDLRLVDVAGDGGARTIATGAPLYVAWAADSSMLLTHIGTGADAALSHQPAQGEATPLPDRPGSFQAPQWSAGDDLVYALDNERDQRLVVAGADGRVHTEVARFTGVVAFALDPIGRRLAFTVHDPGGRDDGDAVEVALRTGARQEGGTAPANALVVADLATGEQQRIADGPVLVQQWAPAGGALLFATLDVADGGAGLRWQVWDGDRVLRFEPVRPTATFAREYLPFFDQYSRSLSLWSPRGDAFAYAARDDDGDGIWVQLVEDGREARRVTGGRSVSWSPL